VLLSIGKLRNNVLETEFAAVFRQESHEDTHRVGISAPSHLRTKRKSSILDGIPFSIWMKTNYLKRYYGQTLEVNEDGPPKLKRIDRVQEAARKLDCRNSLVDAQDRGRR
jgi:hypothetical protein